MVLARSECHTVLSLLRRGGSIAISRLAGLLSSSRSAVEESLSTLSRVKGLAGIFNNTASVAEGRNIFRSTIDGHRAIVDSRGSTITRCYTGLVGSSSFICVSTKAAALGLISRVAGAGTACIAGNVARTEVLVRGNVRACVMNKGVGPLARTIINTRTVGDVGYFGFAGTFVKTGKVSVNSKFAAPSVRRNLVGRATVGGSCVTFILTSRSGFHEICPMAFTPLRGYYVVAGGLPAPRFSRTAIVGRMGG